MFGLTFEKLVLVAVLAAVVIGPHRTGRYARTLGEFARGLRSFVETSRIRTEHELGVSLDRAQWRSLDLRQYDPRRIVRDALDVGAVVPDAVVPDAVVPAPEIDVSGIRPGQRYLVTGPASHPRRILIDTLPADDPRRIAARPVPEPVAAVPVAVDDTDSGPPARLASVDGEPAGERQRI